MTPEIARRNIRRAQLVNTVIGKYSKQYNVSSQLVKNGTRTPRVLKARNDAIAELAARRWDYEAIAKVFNLTPITIRNIVYKDKVERR